MQDTNRKNQGVKHKPITWPENAKPTLVVIQVNGKRTYGYSIHRETYLRNPETGESIRMVEWHNVSLWPIFTPLDMDERKEYVLVFPPLPNHWQTLDVWEMKGSMPLYIGGIKRNIDDVYILSEKCEY